MFGIDSTSCLDFQMAVESGVSLRKRKNPKMESDNDENGSDNDSDSNADSSIESTSVSESVSR